MQYLFNLLICTTLICFPLSATAVNLPEDPPTLERLHKWAKAGDLHSKHDLAVLYLEGRGVAQSYEKSLKLFLSAADEGDTLSMYSLGEMYTRGIGVSPDFEIATQWFTRAATAGAEMDEMVFGTLYYEVIFPEAPLTEMPGSPSDAPLSLPTDPEVLDEEVSSFVTRWARSWTDRNTRNYLGAYSGKFVPAGKISRPRWEAQRRARLEAPQWISIGLSELSIRPLDHGWVRVDFVQNYKSSGYSDRVRKTLMLQKEPGGWRILAERARPAS